MSAKGLERCSNLVSFRPFWWSWYCWLLPVFQVAHYQEAAEVLRLAQGHGLHLAIYENPYYQAGISDLQKKMVP